MVNQLFINACIVFTFSFLAFIPFRDRARRLHMPVLLKMGMGVIAGLMGVVLMINSLPIPGSGLIVDLRHIPLIICAIFMGPWACLVAGIVEAVGRVALFGVSRISLIAAVEILVSSLVIPLVIRQVTRWRYQFLFATAYSLLQSSLIIVLLAPDKDALHLWIVIALYWILSFASGLSSMWIILQLIQHLEYQHRLESMSSVDFLTGLNNTRTFDRQYNACCDQAAASGRPLSLLAIDIDHFKRVNDTYGHPAGDAVLQQVAAVLQTTCRSGDIISRNGGEEFSVLLPDCPWGEGMHLAERIRSAVEARVFTLPGKQTIHVSVSIGLATSTDPSVQNTSLLREADDGLYHAKRSGRNRVCYPQGDAVTTSTPGITQAGPLRT